MNTFSPTDYLHHILDEANFVIQNTSNLTFEKLDDDAILQKALCRSLEIIGEATKNITFPFRNKYPQIQWRAIAAMRDKIIHHYFDVDLEVVYQTCITDIPELAFSIKAILLLEENKNE